MPRHDGGAFCYLIILATLAYTWRIRPLWTPGYHHIRGRPLRQAVLPALVASHRVLDHLCCLYEILLCPYNTLMPLCNHKMLIYSPSLLSANLLSTYRGACHPHTILWRVAWVALSFSRFFSLQLPPGKSTIAKLRILQLAVSCCPSLKESLNRPCPAYTCCDNATKF